eukprot:COSAG02_NODE_22591_length_747_cov_0.961420_1_plen_68_part_00
MYVLVRYVPASGTAGTRAIVRRAAVAPGAVRGRAAAAAVPVKGNDRVQLQGAHIVHTLPEYAVSHSC